MANQTRMVVVALVIAGVAAAEPYEVGAGDDPPIVSSGASFREPPGWQRLATQEGKKTKGWFVPSGKTPNDAPCMILVDIGKPRDAETTPALAEGMARLWGGKVLAETTTLDGVEARRIRVDPPRPGLQPVEGIVAVHQGRAYLLMGGARPGASVADPLEAVRQGWRWASP